MVIWAVVMSAMVAVVGVVKLVAQLIMIVYRHILATEIYISILNF